jgi:hypothetical protein
MSGLQNFDDGILQKIARGALKIHQVSVKNNGGAGVPAQ